MKSLEEIAEKEIENNYESKGVLQRIRSKLVRKVVLPVVAVASLFWYSNKTEAALRSDFDNSGKVDFDDFFMFALHFGEKSGGQSWEDKYDLIKNGVIDFDDFFAFAEDFGKVESPSTPLPTPTPATQIAFTSNRDGNDEIYVMNADGSNQRRLTNTPLTGVAPSWSPDGRRIAFELNRTGIGRGYPEIYVMNADGSNQTRLTNNYDVDSSPSWSPDGSKIAFASERFYDGAFEIYVMNADGSNQRKLTNNSYEDLNPDWSPDGRRIAFERKIFEIIGLGVAFNNDIYMMNSDGSNPKRLTNNPASDSSPAWSPDGSKIAFTSNRDGNDEIYVMNADGSNQTRLTNNSYEDLNPDWSPDGNRIVFQSGGLFRPVRGWDIYIMNVDGGNEVNLTNSLDWYDQTPSWSPR